MASKETSPAMIGRDLLAEERKNEVRRIVHEFATYCVWHLSLTKPEDITQIRVLINELLSEWLENEYVCAIPNCTYCANEVTTRNFRGLFRRWIGRSERGRVR